MKKNIQVILGCDSEYEESDVAVFGAPFDSTTSYRPGARFAAAAIRQESYGIETYSPYLDRDLADCRIFDAGDLELPFGDTNAALAMIEDFTGKLLEDGKKPLMLGGEHLVTLGAFRACAKQYGDLRLIQFDAHADLRDAYLGVSLSHATVMRRCFDIAGNGKIFQYGIRSGEREEFVFAREHTRMRKFGFENLAEDLEAMGDAPIYFTLDLDVLDPGVFCGTGTPEAGGVQFGQLMEALQLVFSRNVVAVDMNELSPPLDQSGASTALACKVLREILLQFSPPYGYRFSPE